MSLDYFFDPTSEDVHSEYHSFSSFADVFAPIHNDFATHDYAIHDFASTPMAKDPTVQSFLSEDDALEATDGIFHTPGHHSTPSIDSLRSPSSDATLWESPVTPGLTNRTSADSLFPGLKSFAWDEATFDPSPFRARPVMSMPSLREEDATTSRLGAVSIETLSLENSVHVPPEDTIFAAFQDDWTPTVEPRYINPLDLAQDYGQLSVPDMIRSVSESTVSRTAPTRSLLSYAPQEFPPTGPRPVPGFTSTPLPDYPSPGPATPRPRMSRAASHQGVRSAPRSTPMAQARSHGVTPNFSPVQMSRAGTQPLPTRRLTYGEPIVHPPPATYAWAPFSSTPLVVHPTPQVHPPPQPRVIARMPSTPMRAKPKAKPRRVASQPSFGFVNFTPDDAEKLLSGVAPSGSNSKRRRDEPEVMRRKRSRSD